MLMQDQQLWMHKEYLCCDTLLADRSLRACLSPYCPRPDQADLRHGRLQCVLEQINLVLIETDCLSARKRTAGGGMREGALFLAGIVFIRELSRAMTRLTKASYKLDQLV